ncbi:MAG: AAA family ATPase, partial [Chloroflexi bacterium]
MPVNLDSKGSSEQASETRDDKRKNRYRFSTAFSPSAPITQQELFASRGTRFDDVLQIITQRGQHGVIYGERGVGKTSFATMMADVYSDVILTGRANCASGEDFSTVVRHLFDSIVLTLHTPRAGFEAPPKEVVITAKELLGKDDLAPDDVRRALALLSGSGQPIVLFIDEFDRIEDRVTRRKFADAIKALSDYAVDATIVLVGVADNVGELIAEHQSINRALVQIHMPRMETSELGEIVDKGMAKGGMAIENSAKEWIVSLSRGLPHYTHLLSLHAGLAAISEDRDTITEADVRTAIRAAITKAQEYILQMYEKATWSTRQTNYREVLLACAVAPTDARGYFAASDVRDPLSTILSRKYEIPNFIANLNKLASEERGDVLQKTGIARSFRYRFRDPLLQPYVILRG